MWPPPDAYALPSKEEIQYMQPVIRDLETHLHLAVRQGSCSQDIIDNLEQELRQRKAWIAPIGRMPHDILSLVFLQTCKIDSNAPFILGGVAKIWRRSLLDTPQAWTYVRLNHLKTWYTAKFVLDCGSPYPLYLDVDRNSSPHLIRALKGHTERIRCLRMETSFIRLLRNPFSNLTKLAVSGDDGGGAIRDPWDLLDGVRFPNLRCLYSGFLLDSMTRTPPPHPLLPPIEELSVSTRDPRFIAGIIRRLADKLTSIDIFLGSPHYFTQDDQPTEILFPRLHDLTIMETSSRTFPSLWPFNARTPALISYKQFPAPPGRNIHKDTQAVRHLAFARRIDFQFFPNLREVSSSSAGIHSLMESLEENPERRPTLKGFTANTKCLSKSGSVRLMSGMDERSNVSCRSRLRSILRNRFTVRNLFVTDLSDIVIAWGEFSGRYESL